MQRDKINQPTLARALRQAMQEIPLMKYHRPYARKVAQRTAELYAYYMAGGV